MGKGCGTVFFLLFAAFGIGFCGVIGFVLFQNARPYFWNKTDCTITASSVFERRSKVHSYTFTVQYQYEYAGLSHSSAVYQPNCQGDRDHSKVARLLEKYPAGSRAVCLVNPDKPAEAALAPGDLRIGLIILLPLVFLAIATRGIIGLWRPKNEDLLADDTT